MHTFSPFKSVTVLFTQQADGSFKEHQKVIELLVKETAQTVSVARLEHAHTVSIISSHINDIYLSDGLLTSLPNQTLSFFVADCFPVVLFDSNRKILALLHCGWKSLYQGILAHSLETLRFEFGSQPHDMMVWIGPGICLKHYTHTQPPVQLDDPQWSAYVKKNTDKTYSIDLSSFIQAQSVQLGIKAVSIVNSNICTFEPQNQLFSHCRAKKLEEPDGRFVVAAWFTAD